MLRFLNFFVPIITMPKNNRNEKNTISNKNLHDNCKFAGTVDCSKSCKDNNKLASGNHKKTCCNNQKGCLHLGCLVRNNSSNCLHLLQSTVGKH